MKTIRFIPVVGLLMLAPVGANAATAAKKAVPPAANAASASSNSAGSMLRIACEGDNKGAEVTINGKFKGPCPIDLQVPEGTVKVLVRKVIDDLEERAYEEEMRIGDGIVKKVDVELGPSRLTAKGEELLKKYHAARLRDDERNAIAGDAVAMMAMATNYHYGYQGGMLERNSEKYVFWLRKAADAGNTDAMYELSSLYKDNVVTYNGKAETLVEKSIEKSRNWLLKSAEAGDSSAMIDLAVAYKDGDLGLARNDATSDSWTRRAFEADLKKARAGDPQAMDSVALAYLLGGSGVAKNLAAVREWQIRAAQVHRKRADDGDYASTLALSRAVLDEKGDKVSDEQKQYWKKLAQERLGKFNDFKKLRGFVRRSEGATR